MVTDIIADTQANNVHSLCLLFANSATPPNADEPPLEPYDATNLQTCAQDLATTGHSLNVQIGHVVIQGDQALVSLVGTDCQNTPCATSSDQSRGMPGAGVDFAHAFAAAVDDDDVFVPVPCQVIAGRWYAIDDDNDS